MCLSLAAPPGAGRVAPACGRLLASAMILSPPPFFFHLSFLGRLEDKGRLFGRPMSSALALSVGTIVQAGGLKP